MDVAGKESKTTPLWWSCRKGPSLAPVALRMIELGVANVNVKDVRIGTTPLYWAAYWGMTDVVEALLAVEVGVYLILF